MKLLGIIIVLVFVIVFIFWPGHYSNQQLHRLISGNSQQTQPNQQQASKSKLASHEISNLLNIDIQSGVAQDNEKAIREGIRIMDFYLNEWFGKSLNQQAGLRADANTATSVGEDAKVTMENGKMVILISTNSPIWKQMLDMDKQVSGQWTNTVSAHEYVHVYQFQNGCGSIASEKKIAPKWFAEGEAVLLSFKASMDSGSIPSFLGLEQTFLMQFKQAKDVKPLSTYEKEAAVDPLLYSYFALAVNQLIKNKDIKILDNFCSNLGQGQAVPTAFQNAFGISLVNFYSDFETYRQKLK